MSQNSVPQQIAALVGQMRQVELELTDGSKHTVIITGISGVNASHSASLIDVATGDLGSIPFQDIANITLVDESSK